MKYMEKGENVEFVKKLWKENRARGPDVEEILIIPLFIAIEDKRTARKAFDDIAQIIGYAESGRYDAVIIRLEESPEADQSYKRLVNLAKMYGVGIVAGGSPYNPLGGSEEVLLKAKISFREKTVPEIPELRSIKIRVQGEEELVKHLFAFRRFLTEGGSVEEAQT